MKALGLASVVFIAQFGSAFSAEPSREETWDRIVPSLKPPAQFANDFGSYKSPLIFESGRKVKSSDEWHERRREIVAKWTRSLGECPALLEKPKIEFIEKEKRENFVQHRVRIEVAPHQLEEAFLLIPEGVGPYPAVIVPFYEAKTSIGRGSVLLDFGYQLTKRGLVTLSIGSPGGSARDPATGGARCQPLSFLAYVASNCRNVLAGLPEVDRERIGIVGHSYGGKWAMFASCLDDNFACAVWSDPGIVFDETRPNVNYWEPWYLGLDREKKRNPGVPTQTNPRTGPYKELFEGGSDLHELHALMAPRPFLVSGGSEDPPERWRALNHTVSVNSLLGFTNRVAMTNRKGHTPTPESNEQIFLFFEYFLNARRP